MKINRNFEKVVESYLFSDIAKRVDEFKRKNPDADLIRMGIGDVTLPLGKTVVEALKRASLEMGDIKTFRGYGKEQGYDFLREKICEYYRERKIELLSDEIFVSDGAKSDIANILDIFDDNITVLVQDPVYPVYVDTNIMKGNKVIFLDGNQSNDFLPMPNYDIKCDLIYLCSPNNPTGAVYNKQQLKEWINYALKNDAVILFDSAYERFIKDKNLPKSIYEIEDAKKVAIEFCSLSKTAGFTGTRCGYTVIPKSLGLLNKMWSRRTSTKFNGTSYVVQRGAEAVFSKDGQEEVETNIEYYRKNAMTISKMLDELGIYYTGGKNSPYIWMKTPKDMSSWAFFDMLLNEAFIVGTPGSGFGQKGEGYFRLTSFNTYENTVKACERIKTLLKNV